MVGQESGESTPCQYCGQDCFAPLPNNSVIRQAYLVRGVTVMATCSGGQVAEKKLIGYNYDDCTEDTMEEKTDILDEVIKAAPVVNGEKWAIFGQQCLWWTTFPDDVDKSGVLDACPFCGGPLDKKPLEQFVEIARHKVEHGDFEKGGYGSGGLRTLMKAHHRSAITCRTRWDRLSVKVHRRTQ